MGIRFKPETTKLETLEDVNLAMRDIGLWQRDLDAIDTQANKEIAEIKTKASKAGEPLRDKISATVAKIQAFAEYNKDDYFVDRKSVDLSFGTMGWRKSTSISIKKTTTLELLKKLKLDKYIRVKEEPNKETMAELDDDTLASVDAVRKVKNDFFVEAKTEEVNKDLLKAGA